MLSNYHHVYTCMMIERPRTSSSQSRKAARDNNTGISLKTIVIFILYYNTGHKTSKQSSSLVSMEQVYVYLPAVYLLQQNSHPHQLLAVQG